MSSSNYINMSNKSPAKSPIPLPFPCPPMPAPPAMLPCTVANALCANKNMPQTITNGLLSTIAKRETDTAVTHLQLTKHIQEMKERICHYKKTFNTPPAGYTTNASHIPNFHIPVSPNLYYPAKWVKLNSNRTVSGYANTQGPHNEPFITKLYTQPNFKYNEDANPIPALPIPVWFRHLLIRPANEFQLLHNVATDTGDWSIYREIARYCNLNNEVNELSTKLDLINLDLNTACNQ
jgi:hypothetical protein